MRLCLQRATSFKSAAKVSGALALISNCQITFAWVISRRNTVPPTIGPPSTILHPFERTPLPRIWQPGRMQLHRWLWWAEHSVFSFLFFLFFELAPQAQILKWCPTAVRCPKDPAGHATHSLTHSYTRLLAHPGRHSFQAWQGLERGASSSRLVAQLSQAAMCA